MGLGLRLRNRLEQPSHLGNCQQCHLFCLLAVMNVVARSILHRRLPLRRWLVTRPSSSTASFPCVDAHAARESRILSNITSPQSSESGPEPPYERPSPTSYKKFHHPHIFPLTYGSHLPSFDIAYETWGTLSPSKDNAILLHTGLSASSHAASTTLNAADGWWEKFIGPGKALDTNQFYVVCTNVLGGCYGSTGPSSFDPNSLLLRHQHDTVPTSPSSPYSIWSLPNSTSSTDLGIHKLYASVGSSMGAMQSLAAAWLHPDRVGKVVSISGTARSSPGSVAMRYAQRSVLMADPNWNKGFYYDGLPPHIGYETCAS
jgi:homoserine acetyltransferase